MTDDHPLEEVTLRQFPLALQRVTSRRVVPKAMRYQSSVTPLIDLMLEDMVVEVCAFMAVDQIVADAVTVDRFYWEHASWWQHTKDAFPPLRWLSTKVGRPPRKVRRRITVEFNMRQYVGFPDADIYPVELGKPIIVESLTWRNADDDED